MIQERIIYEFGEVPVEVGGYTIYPNYDLVVATKTKDVNKWIQRLYREVRDYLEGYGGLEDVYLTMVIWNTGMGSWSIR